MRVDRFLGCFSLTTIPSVHRRSTGEAAAPGGGERAGAEERVNLEEIEQSHKAVLKLYGRTVNVLRDKRERELLAEALCDVGDLHVSHYQRSAILNGLETAHLPWSVFFPLVGVAGQTISVWLGIQRGA